MTTYFLETKLDFARDVQDAVLDIANNDVERLEYRAPPWSKIMDMDPRTTIKEMIELVGAEDTRLINERRKANLEVFGKNAKKISFRQYSLPKDLNDALIDAAPAGIPKDECIPIVQISTGGNILYPHKGHYRNASLFCLLQGAEEETRWYKETEPFRIIKDFRIPDVKKLEVAAATTLRKRVWTLFNHYEWHSVHSKVASEDFIMRVNVGIDMKTWTVDQMMQALEGQL